MERDQLAHLSVLPEFKTFEKLVANIVADLERKTFSEASLLEEFLGIKWTRQAVKLILMQVHREYDIVITKAMKREAEEEMLMEELEKMAESK